MKPFEPKTFNIPTLTGISAESVGEHLKLYEGYIKNANLIMAHLPELFGFGDKYLYEASELHRRFSFEYNGIRNHEYYFEQIEIGPVAPDTNSLFCRKIIAQAGSFETWQAGFTELAKTRGVGWAVVYYDTARDELIHSWVDEQHVGHLNSCQFIFGIDMWEHSYVADYQPSGKGRYITDYLANVNWSVVENRFLAVSSEK